MLNIVIVGGSFAGHAAANILSASLPPQYRVVLIDANDFATHLPAVVRALVVPESESRNLTALLRDSTVFPTGSRHKVVHARVLTLGDGVVTLDRNFEGSAQLPFSVRSTHPGSQRLTAEMHPGNWSMADLPRPPRSRSRA